MGYSIPALSNTSEVAAFRLTFEVGGRSLHESRLTPRCFRISVGGQRELFQESLWLPRSRQLSRVFL